MNPTRSRLLIFLRDALRRPYNAGGLWLLWLWLAWPGWLAILWRRVGRAGVKIPPMAPPIARSFAAWRAANARRPAARGARYITIFPGARVAQPIARTISTPRRQPWILHRYENTRCAPAFVAGLPRGQYHAPAHDIFGADGQLLPDLSFFGPENRFAESREYVRRFARGLPETQFWPGVTAALPALFADVNYFHWMFQVLPRFELLRLAGITNDQVDRYLVDRTHYPFHMETLAKLRIPEEKLVAADGNTHVTAEYLWTTSSLRLSGHLNSWVADFLRREFLGATPAAGGERIYVSRADASQRQLVNEPEIVARLGRLGFRPIIPGRLSVTEQARVFAGAGVIVAPHGAGLANLVFAPPGTKVLELFSPARRGMAYWELSNARRLDYFYLIGQVASSDADLQAFRVPLAWLDALLDRAAVR